ncbi:MAG: DUF502 domain-containing protein [Candidatus Omnitrophota bacterium]
MLTKIRNYFISGLVIFLPMALTAYLFILTLNFLDGQIAKFIEPIIFEKYGYYFEGVHRFAFHFLCALIGVFLIILIGILARNFIGKKVYELFEQTLVKLPFFRQVYPAFKEMIIFLFPRDKVANFKQVVLVEYPRKGIYAVGFLTNDSPKEILDKTKQDVCNVFIPTSPSPLTGFTTIIPRTDLIFLNMSIEGAFKFLISGGVVNPTK